MFIQSFRLTRRKVAVTVVALAAVVAVAGYWLGKGSVEPAGAPAAETTEQQPVGQMGTLTATTQTERIAFASRFGWKLAQGSEEVVEVVIPEEFDETLTQYNQIQIEQGMDLSALKGKRVKRYTYEVTNYPGQPQDIHLDLLVYEGKVVGGDVCSVALDGFMHGFAAPERTDA